MTDDSRVRIIFLGGIGRSGTTLLERSISSGHDVVALGEVMHLWARCLAGDELCGCGLPFSDCEFWVEAGRRAFGGWDRVDPARLADLKGAVDRAILVPRLVSGMSSAKWRDEVREYVSYYSRLYRAISDMTGAGVLIDSSKQVSLAYLLMTDLALDVRVVHVVRDARAVAYSWTKQVERPEARDGEALFMQTYSPGRLSVYWMLHNVELDVLGVLRRGRRLRLRYEDWIESPHDSIARIRKFAGLNVESGMGHIDGATVTLATAHTCSGNPVRFKTGPVELRRDTAWLKKLPVRDSSVVAALTWPELLHYRYPMRRRGDS